MHLLPRWKWIGIKIVPRKSDRLKFPKWHFPNWHFPKVALPQIDTSPIWPLPRAKIPQLPVHLLTLGVKIGVMSTFMNAFIWLSLLIVICIIYLYLCLFNSTQMRVSSWDFKASLFVSFCFQNYEKVPRDKVSVLEPACTPWWDWGESHTCLVIKCFELPSDRKEPASNNKIVTLVTNCNKSHRFELFS